MELQLIVSHTQHLPLHSTENKIKLFFFLSQHAFHPSHPMAEKSWLINSIAQSQIALWMFLHVNLHWRMSESCLYPFPYSAFPILGEIPVVLLHARWESDQSFLSPHSTLYLDSIPVYVCTVCKTEILPANDLKSWYFGLQNVLKVKRNKLSYVTVVDGIHGQQVVAMAELEVDDLQSGLDLSHLSGLSWTALPHHVLQQQAVLTDPLHRLQQVRPQIHLIPQLQLLLLVCEESRQCSGSLMLEMCR